MVAEGGPYTADVGRYAVVISLVGAYLVIACSSGSGGAASSGGSATCDSLCDRTVALPCTTNTLDQCLSSCETDASEKGACKGTYLQTSSCTIEKFGCDLPTTPLSAVVNECLTEFVAYAACSACEPDSSDDQCDSCGKANCCSQRKAAYSDPDVLRVSGCAANCQDPICVDACLAPYPNAKTKVEAFTSCQASACPGC